MANKFTPKPARLFCEIKFPRVFFFEYLILQGEDTTRIGKFLLLKFGGNVFREFQKFQKSFRNRGVLGYKNKSPQTGDYGNDVAVKCVAK